MGIHVEQSIYFTCMYPHDGRCAPYTLPIQLHQYSASWKEENFLMPGMSVTAYFFPKRHTTPPHLSQNGADIFPCVAHCVDDSILWDDDVLSFWHTVRYFKLCADNGIVFNPDRFHFTKDEMIFAGFDIGST